MDEIRYYSIVFTDTDKHVLMKDKQSIASPITDDKDFIDHYESQQQEIERVKCCGNCDDEHYTQCLGCKNNSNWIPKALEGEG